MNNKKLIVGISGASGSEYGVRLLQVLQQRDIETHLIISKSAEITMSMETTHSLNSIKALADKCYSANDIAAAISSGSFPTLGMVIAPCSIRTMSEIATGVTSSLMSRAADVVLKEQRKLVLMVRETPLHLGHLRTLTQLSEMGAIIAPPMPAFYNQPQDINDVVNHSVGRVLDLFNIDTDVVKRWGIDAGKK